MVEPLADVELKPPGEIEIAVAPLVAHVSVLLAPELMLAGFAANDVIVGAEPPLGGGLEEPGEPPQPLRPKKANKPRTNALRWRAPRLCAEKQRPEAFKRALRRQLRKTMCIPSPRLHGRVFEFVHLSVGIECFLWLLAVRTELVPAPAKALVASAG